MERVNLNIAQSAQVPREVHRGANRLAQEKSPYLLQHADNPVNWYPWGEEAFARAKAEDKPVFLSIGYSSCHWCHVMERECFADADVANLMNAAFVCVKVDREERPDLDDVYMAVCQMMTGSGGWPLTVILTPDKKPIFAGTYIPKEARFGRTGMVELIPRIEQVWQSRRGEALQSAERITATLTAAVGSTEKASAGLPDRTHLDRAYELLAGSFDERYGGFGSAPKFPSPHHLLFLLRYGKRSGDSSAVHLVEKTLEAMRLGGMYDHLGFGFHRYSTDARWRVPHFEKMLYDQALLSLAYVEAFQATGKAAYAETARQVFSYVMNKMTVLQGGFCSAEDADSAGEEGKYYLWKEGDIRVLLGSEAGLFERAYNVEAVGNFTDPLSGQMTCDNVLYLLKPLEALASDFGMPEKEFGEQMERCRRKLLTERERRVLPHRDDKILTDWNGLMIAALAKGAQALDEPRYAEAAQTAADFILAHLRGSDGRLLHRYRDGQAAIPGYLDDYSFFIWGLIELYEYSFEVRYLEAAVRLQDLLLTHFWDTREGGFFFTADDAEELLVRRREAYDGALPSGNSAALLDLLRLAHLTANPLYEEKADQLMRAFEPAVRRYPAGYACFLMGLDFALGPSYEVVIAGDRPAEGARQMLRALHASFIPNKVILHRPNDPAAGALARLAPFTEHMISLNGQSTAYVCRSSVCNLPTTRIEEMLAMLT